MSRKNTLHRRNWNRSLWLDLRHCERAYAWHARWLRQQQHAEYQGRHHAAMVASTGRLMLAVARSAEQCRRFLGL